MATFRFARSMLATVHHLNVYPAVMILIFQDRLIRECICEAILRHAEVLAPADGTVSPPGDLLHLLVSHGLGRVFSALSRLLVLLQHRVTLPLLLATFIKLLLVGSYRTSLPHEIVTVLTVLVASGRLWRRHSSSLVADDGLNVTLHLTVGLVGRGGLHINVVRHLTVLYSLLLYLDM